MKPQERHTKLQRAILRQQDKNQVLISHGRAPWYGPDGKNVEAYVIGIAGGSASGKTSVARAILSALDWIPTVLILSQDSFYKAHTEEEIKLAFQNNFDLDHPNAIDTTLFAQCLRDLKDGKATEIPVYSFVHHQRMPETNYIYGASVIIVQGIMALQSPELRDLYDLKVFVNCDSDMMLARRIKRDIKERGRDVDGILDQYLRFVKSSYDNFVYPSSRYADIIVPGSSNHLAIELLVTHVKRQLETRSIQFRQILAHMGDDVPSEGAEKLDKQIILLDQTNQLRGIMTILRDKTTSREEFIFHIDRVSTIIVETALALIPCQPKTIRTPQKNVYQGLEQTKDLVGISILRSGGPFSQGLRRVIRDVPIGGILIQSNPRTGEPLLLKSDLPHCIRSRKTSGAVRCLLLDSQMGTGAAAMMAIRVLLDHGIPQEHIVFLTYLISRPASHSVLRAFPRIHIVTAAIDPGLDELRFAYHFDNLVGEAAGEGDFAVRYVNGVRTSEEGIGDELETDQELIEDQSRIPVNKAAKELTLLKKQGEELVGEKSAWVISPGMGHVGDRYYLV
ncbi:uridine kinase [Cryptococcus depauperatus CBS 7841]|uniref:Uridine kinase n=1 Tax=Cryptococcus depauperatus CBS 7841 TaxID=1295531 RepID=A0AAJ8JPR2_9TREE